LCSAQPVVRPQSPQLCQNGGLPRLYSFGETEKLQMGQVRPEEWEEDNSQVVRFEVFTALTSQKTLFLTVRLSLVKKTPWWTRKCETVTELSWWNSQFFCQQSSGTHRCSCSRSHCKTSQ
jgi:hypothetical protein